MRQYILTVLTVVECLVNAQINYTTDPDRCVHSQSYKDCISTLNYEQASCIFDDPINIEKGIACSRAAERLSLDCVYENCWNVVYSCEVQTSAVVFALSEGGSNLPYYPAPEDAPGRCSCNLEAVETVVSRSLGLSRVCEASVSTQNGVNACSCCSQAGAYAGLFDLCPSVDPALLLNGMDGIDSLLQTYDPQFEQCTGLLQQVDCQNDLGYPDLGYGLAYLTTVPSTTGTGSYSNLPGTLATPTASSYGAAGSVQATATNVNEAGSSGEADTRQGDGGSDVESQQSATTAMKSDGIGSAASSASMSPSTNSASSRTFNPIGVVSLLVYGIACSLL